jgi:NADPH-dependent glutamate synthase beta subunit-like oxidoreductase
MSEVRYQTAASLEDAATLLGGAGDNASPLAGGTDVFGTLKDGIHGDGCDVLLVDLKTIPGLDEVTVADGDLVIGAMVRLADVVADGLVQEHAPMLAQAAALVASPQLREMGTVGGNLCQEPRCWYYRYPGDVFHCHRKGGELCAAAVGDDRYHSVFGAARVADPPCVNACPNNTAIPGYLELLRRMDTDAAARELLTQNPIPSITGRICPHLCEEGCNRAALDESVSIRGLEQRVGDYVLANPELFLEGCAPSTGQGVTVVGSGPAGLAAAFYLRRQGHRVTVIDRETVGGGMLSLGIPPFRLDRDVVGEVLGLYEKLGVEFRFGVEVGRDVTLDELRAEADAVVVASGAWVSPAIGIGGQESAVGGLDYLRHAALDAEWHEGGSVLVVGGGNVAVDCAMTAAARGATKVVMACLESRDQMPAFAWEIEEALERGVELMPGWGPRSIRTESGAVVDVELVQCTSVFDEHGAFCPALDESVTERVAAGTVVLAVGQRVDRAWYADAVGAAASAPVFVCGDAETGPATVVEAIASSRRAAAGVAASLREAAGHPAARAGMPSAEAAGATGETVAAEVAAFLEHDVAGSLPARRALAQQPAALSFCMAAAAVFPEDAAVVGEAKRCLNCSCLAVSPSDLAPALIALGASIETNRRVLDAADLFAAALNGSTTLDCGELVLAVHVPLAAAGDQAAFKKFRPRKSIDFPVVNVAVALRLDDGAIAAARICAGAVAPVPLRLEAAERLLIGKRPAADVFAEAAEAAVAQARPLHKNEYKREILKVLVRRSLEEAAGLESKTS